MEPGILRWELIIPTRGLHHGFQGTIKAKKCRKIVFHLPKGGMACSDRGAKDS